MISSAIGKKHARVSFVLVQGDSLYLTAFENGDISREGFLLVNELPVCRTNCRWSADNSNNWSIVIEAEPCQSESDTISPVEAHVCRKLPIMVTNIDLPIVVEPIEVL